MQENIKKLGHKSIIEVLLNPPKDYQNLSLISKLAPQAQGVLKVIPLSYRKSAKVLKIFTLLPDFNEHLEITIFHPKPFHKSLFPLQIPIHIYGILQKRFAYEIIQPKVVQEFGKIMPIFERIKQKNTQIIEITQKLITQENLQAINLPQEMIDSLLPLFHPTPHFLENFRRFQGFPPKTLESLKTLEVYVYLSRLRQKRKDFPAKFSCHGEFREFVASLPFPLTKGQSNAIKEISQDFKSLIASKRIIMGDVGCGKTIVILASVMMVYPHKSLLMAPTTILTQQIYNEALKFLPQNVRVGLFASDSKKQDFKNFDFIIGTQALLHRDEDLSEFALVMSDEQHRFGTMQRHTLEKLASLEGKKPHILQFSATPIPRTMAMLQSELISHTFIKDTPFIKDITTEIFGKQDFPTLLAHIHSEISQNHQIAIVYPLVEESENLNYLSLKEAEEYWFRNFEGVYSTNGRDKNKDEVLQQFREKGNILLSTTVIEVGISLPRLSTIVIVGAERMGFATLHQLRGRVSRNGLKGYCFLLTHQNDSKRLSEFARSKDGFEIAEIDLRYRKGGDLLEGKNQSGDEFRFFDPAEDEIILQKAQKLQITNLL